MTTVTIDDELAARIRAVSPDGQDWSAFVADALRERLERVEREAALSGPRRPYDPAATYRRHREEYGWEDLSHLTREEVEDQGDAVLAALPPEKIAEAERLGLL